MPYYTTTKAQTDVATKHDYIEYYENYIATSPFALNKLSVGTYITLFKPRIYRVAAEANICEEAKKK